MSGRPIIGITMGAPNERQRLEQPVGYHQAVQRAGGRAIHIAPDDADLDGLVGLLDGIVFSGGADIDPSFITGGHHHEAMDRTHPPRDAFEIELIKRVLGHELPTLAICRGLQVLNVALGGNLHPHLPDVGDDIDHRADPPGPLPHRVVVEEGTVVAAAMGTTTVEIASWHHQALDALGCGLRPVAHAADGTIEAVEVDTAGWVAAVQWHPEITAHDDPTQQGLFDELVALAGTQ